MSRDGDGRYGGQRHGGRAFTALRREIAQMLRQGPAGAAVDYSPALGEMAQTLAAVRERLAGIKAKPGLGLTTVGLGQQIEAAGQRAGTRAGQALAAALEELVGRTATRRDQRRSARCWGWRCGMCCPRYCLGRLATGSQRR